MDLVIRNISLLQGENLEYIDRGYVVIQQGIIEDVAKGDYKGEYSMPIYDGEGILAIPGFINAHTHIGDSIGKDISVETSFESKIHPIHGIKNKILRNSNRKHLVNFMKSAALSMMRMGIVAFADFRECELEGINQIKEAVSGLSIKAIVLGRPEFYYDIALDSSKNPNLPSEVIEQIQKILNFAEGLGISGANENTDNSLKDYRKAIIKNSLKKKLLLGIHGAESLETDRRSFEKTRKSEVQRIIANLLPNFIVHLTMASDSDIELVARKKIGIVICPRANSTLGVGIPRVSKMLSFGCCIAIGTDNVMVNSPDMFRELDYIWKISKTLDGPITARDILKMATVNGGKILGINSGALMTGMSADIIFIDKNNLDISPIHDPYVSIVHRANVNSILNVMINGKFVDGDEFNCMSS